MSQLLCPEGVPNIVLIGLPDQAALKRAMTKLSANHVPHYCWEEPDYDFGLTAIATAPIQGAKRAALANYRVYAPVAQIVEQPVLSGKVVGADPTRCANGGCADASSAPA